MTIASDSQALAADILNHADASGFPKWKKGEDLTSASALTLGSDGNAFDVTGTNAITSIATRGIGAIILLHFDAVLTFTHHSTNLVLPDGENITTAAGDVAVLHEFEAGKWRLVSYSRADAASGVLSVANGGTGAATLTDGGVLLGSGTGAVTAMSVLSDGEMIVGDGTTDPVAESDATLRTSIGVGTGDSPQFTGIELGHATDTTIARSGSGDITVEGNAVYRAGGTDVPVADGGTGASSLTDGGVLLGSGTGAVTAMAELADGEMIVGDGSTDPVAESGATLRTSIGVGTGDSPQFTGVELGHASDTTIARSGSGDITIEGNAVYRAGGTDVPVADGGTGASSLTANGVLIGNGTSAVSAVDLSTKGKILVGDGSGNPQALAVGSNDQVLIADSGEATGVKWGAGASGGIASLAADTSPQLGGFLDANGNYMQTEKGGDISSASPLVIDTDGDYFNVTGTTNYAAMTVAADRQFTLQFDGALTMTHHATNLDLPGEANITTAAGDVGVFQSTGANTVQCISYTKANGEAVVSSSGGGITHASIWTLTTSFTGTQAPINANLSETSTDGQGRIGDAMTESSGIFTFPATGYWWIMFQIETNDNINSPYNEAMIRTTTDNSSYTTAAQSATYLVSGETRYTSATLNILFDVTNTSTHKVRFDSVPEQSGVTTAGSSGANHTYMTFIRLGDT